MQRYDIFFNFQIFFDVFFEILSFFDFVLPLFVPNSNAESRFRSDYCYSSQPLYLPNSDTSKHQINWQVRNHFF